MNRDDNAWAQASRYLSLGLILPASTCIGYLIGYLLDRLFHTSFLAVIFLVLGTVAGFVALLRALNIKSKTDGS
ncbi:MAG: AtpZ/AtpI family protein [Bryobacteraceae bacterium]|jgi:F0F1-type ATP synthase assembly protein I